MILTEENMGKLVYEFYTAFGSWMRYQYKQMEKDKNLTLAQFRLLFKIKDFEICNMSSLSEAIEISRGTATSMLNKMVEGGYVKRETSLEDRRNVYVSLTAKGEKELNKMKRRFFDGIIGSLLELGQDDREEIYLGLKKLTDIFKGKE